MYFFITFNLFVRPVNTGCDLHQHYLTFKGKVWVSKWLLGKKKKEKRKKKCSACVCVAGGGDSVFVFCLTRHLMDGGACRQTAVRVLDAGD